MAVFDILSNSGILPYYLLGIRASFIRKYGKVRQKVLSDVRNTIYDDMPCKLDFCIEAEYVLLIVITPPLVPFGSNLPSAKRDRGN